VTSPAARESWTAALKADEGALVSQSLPWRDSVFAAGQHIDASRLYEFESGRQVVVPLARRRRMPPGCGVVTSWPPSAEIGGPICAGGEIARPEAAAILADLARLDALSVQIRLRSDVAADWLAVASGWQVDRQDCYVLDLRPGFDDIWTHRFRSSVRQGVRKAERAQLEIETGRSGALLDAFCDLYAASIKRWAESRREPVWLARRLLTQEFSRPRLDRMAKHFGDALTVWLARRGGQPAAAVVILKAGSYAKYWRGAMDKDLAGPVQANNLLHRLVIEDACASGFGCYDMGFGDAPQLVAFKQKLGAVAKSTLTLRRERLPVHRTRLRAESVIKRSIGVLPES
jgi:CelD/BcsL family acetyltransferase involved in cellulose biosynthesis